MLNQNQAFNLLQDRHDYSLPEDNSIAEAARTAAIESEIDRLTNSAEERQDIICEHLRWCDQRNMVAEVLGNWAFEASTKMTEAERDQGIIDLATLILIPMAQAAIAEVAERNIEARHER